MEEGVCAARETLLAGLIWRIGDGLSTGWTTGSQGSKREKFPNRPNSIVRDLRKADGKSWDEQVVRNVCLRCDASLR
jgi:hypothetical protein